MKTGLVLGGGGSRGSYQLGVWKALSELSIFPDVITGTSVGALNGALMIQDSYDTAVKLWESLDTKAIFDFPKEPDFFEYAKAFFRQGGVCRNGLKKLIHTHLQEDVIRNSKTSLGMMLSRRCDLAPCGVFTEDIPKGMLPEYLMATTACFPATQCYRIDGVDYLDGGYCDNLPIGLAKKKGAKRLIAVGLDRRDMKELSHHRDVLIIPVCPKWELGNWLIFRKENTGRNIRLGYLDAMKAFGVYEGNAYTFRKNTFQKLYEKRQVTLSRWYRFFKSKNLLPDIPTAEGIKNAAEITGKCLKISPFCVYTADSFLKAVHRKKECITLQKTPSPFYLATLFSKQPCKVLHYRKQYPKETTAGIFLSVFS